MQVIGIFRGITKLLICNSYKVNFFSASLKLCTFLGYNLFISLSNMSVLTAGKLVLAYLKSHFLPFSVFSPDIPSRGL